MKIHLKEGTKVEFRLIDEEGEFIGRIGKMPVPEFPDVIVEDYEGKKKIFKAYEISDVKEISEEEYKSNK